MTRSFTSEAVDPEIQRRILDQARRVPSAGNSQGFDVLLLEGNETSRYWDITLPEERRENFRWQGLLRAPLMVMIWANPDAYVDRYRQSDKASTGLGEGADAWSTPFWLVDASFMAMTLQLAAINEGLGVLFFGMFDHADALADAFGVPPERVPVGSVALGWPDVSADELGRSANKARRPLEDAEDKVVHRGTW